MLKEDQRDPIHLPPRPDHAPLQALHASHLLFLMTQSVMRQFPVIVSSFKLEVKSFTDS